MINKGIERIKGDEKPGKALQFKTQIVGRRKVETDEKKIGSKVGFLYRSLTQSLDSAAAYRSRYIILKFAEICNGLTSDKRIEIT